MVIKVLGSGCANCTRLEALTRQAVEQLGAEAQVEKVTDIGQIMSYGVMSTPALVIDEKVVLAGGVPSLDRVVALIRQAG